MQPPGEGRARLPTIAKVAVNDATIHFDKLYSYLVPPELSGQLWPGGIVLVPFGRGDKPRMAVVLQMEETADPDPRLKTLLAAAPEDARLTPDLLDLVSSSRTGTSVPGTRPSRPSFPMGRNIAPAPRTENRWCRIA